MHNVAIVKIGIIICMMMLLCSSKADDLFLKSGKIYRNYQIYNVNASGLEVKHEYGAAIVPFSDLPENLREKYSAQEKKFEAVKQVRAEARRKQQTTDKQRQHRNETLTESSDSENMFSKSGESTKNSEKKTSSPKGNTVEYAGPRTIYIGPRGGRYYINSHGKKTYIRRKK